MQLKNIYIYTFEKKNPTQIVLNGFENDHKNKPICFIEVYFYY